jgi:site-specific DNA recombinase
VLRGESLRTIAFDFNKRGIKPAGAKKNGENKIDKWQGCTLRRVLISPRIAGLREHNGEVVGKSVWPTIIDEATHDRRVGLLKDPSRRPLNYGRSRLHPLTGLVYCGSCGGQLVATSNRGRVAATGAGKTRTQTAKPESESPPSLWRLTSRAT